MKRYRVDIFDRAFNFVDMAQIPEPTLIVDYLVQSNSTFRAPKRLTINRGYYAQIRDDSGAMFQGIVTDFVYDGDITSVTLSQMSKLLDVEVFANVATLSNGIENWMKSQINAVYNNADTEQKLTGLTITTSTTTAGSYPPNDDQIYNLYDLAVHFFKVYGVIISISFDITNRTITFLFTKLNTNSVWKIETKLADVANYSINSSMSGNTPNKMIIRNAENTSQSATYYWHPQDYSGTVDTDRTTNRVQPVIQRCAVVTVQQGDTFSNAAMAEAVNTMYQSQYDDQIEITFNSASKLVEVGEIGQCYSVIDGNKTYHTVLTGYQRLNEKYTRLTFGYVRTRLTQILQQERRKNR